MTLGLGLGGALENVTGAGLGLRKRDFVSLGLGLGGSGKRDFVTCCCYCCSCCYCYICNKAVTKLHFYFGVVVSRVRQVTSHVPASATRRSQVTFLSCGCLAGPGHESRSCVGDKAVTKSRLQLWFLG